MQNPTFGDIHVMPVVVRKKGYVNSKNKKLIIHFMFEEGSFCS